jgi:hypothetical protein
MNIVKSNGKRYLGQMPEFSEGLPFGILNKKATDAGGSFTAINCSGENYIVVVPFRDLVDSLVADKNCQYKVQGVYGGTSYNDVKDYLLSNKVHKFAVTYDSLPKLKVWIERNGFDSSGYKVLVDEFHLLLEDMGFRYKAIDNLMLQIKSFKHYTFMSATPMRDDFLTDMFKELPYTEVEWDNNKTIRPVRVKTPNVYQATVKLISQFIDGNLVVENYKGEPTKVEELYIFLNSVKGIKQVIESARLRVNEVKVVCADTVRNKTIMDKYDINKVTDPNAKVNFFTRKGFQGCNLFTNNGLIVVISDGGKANTLIDIETTLYQIAGRLRINDEFNNEFKHSIWHIYSNRRSVQDLAEFEVFLNNNIEETNTVIGMYNKASKDEKELQAKRLDIDDLVCYYDDVDEVFVYSELKEKYFRYNYRVVNEVYTNGLSIRDAYINAGLDAGKQGWTGKLEDVVLASIVTFGFKEMFEQYADLRESTTFSIGKLELIEQMEKEEILLKPAYDKLGRKGVKTANYNEKDIKERLYATDDKTLEVVYKNFFNKVGDGNFISNKDAKQLLINIYKKFKITSYKPTTTMLKECKWFKLEDKIMRIDGTLTRGMLIKSIK